ncbi:hypothetical protein [Paenarthrobacter sp. FR1]|uniref:hypothetical protein n=1 Tax=Paenarthrobacter sp. FR1 TaxID=3439548 RepID=UPI003DA598D8
MLAVLSAPSLLADVDTGDRVSRAFVDEGHRTLGEPLVIYAVVTLATVVAFVKGYEEPTLTETYGGQYLNYRRNVPGWWPRLTPWRE